MGGIIVISIVVLANTFEVLLMKSTLLFCLSLLIASIPIISCSDNPTQPPSNDIPFTRIGFPREVPDSLAALYRLDAAALALRIQLNSPLKDSVEIHADLAQTLYNALTSVWSSAPDSIVASIEGIHVRGAHIILTSVLVGADCSWPWMERLRSGDSVSGNEHFDEIMRRYHLRLNAYYAFSCSHVLDVRSTEPVNTTALAKKFATVPTVTFAETNGVAGDGDNIEAYDMNGYWKLDYSVGYGDCPSGCIYRHYWTFHVYADGKVEFVGERGYPAQGSWVSNHKGKEQ